MSPSVRLREALGRKLASDEVVLHFSARLDESDTHDRSIYTVIGGAIATTDQWDGLEAAWKVLLEKSKISGFHYKDFEARQKDFSGWQNFVAKRFLKKWGK